MMSHLYISHFLFYHIFSMWTSSEKEKEPFIEVNINPVKKYLIINILNKYTSSKDYSETTKNEKHVHEIGIHSVKHTVKNIVVNFILIYQMISLM